MAPKKYCTRTVKDRATGQVRQCRKPVAGDQTLCHNHREQSISTSNPGIATDYTPPQTPPATPPASANTNFQKIRTTSHDSTPHKANQTSIADGNLSARREDFCANLEELTLVKMDCAKKIDF